MSNNANLIKQLREKTGAGILDCKSALVENNNEIDKAIDWLRKKGLSVAAKKSGRIAAEGLIGTYINENKGCIIEINSETDFVSRNEIFQNFVKNCSILSINSDSDVDKLKKMNYFNTENSVEEELTKNIATIGENINIRRIETLKIENEGLIVSYVHNSVGENLGKIGVLISLESNVEKDKLLSLGKQIAMHVAASKPLAKSVDQLDPKLIEKEKSILIEQALSSGKSKEIAEKMVTGRIKKFYEEVVLEEQTFVVDGKSSVKKVIEEYSKNYKDDIKLVGFKIFVLGEGIDVDEKDFASEVAETAKM